MKEPFHIAHKVRFVTAASLFDGHDVSINIIRRILQANGAEVIHLGHNRSAIEIVDAAIQEDAQGIAISSYQGGHMEFFKYVVDLLRQKGAGHIKVFGGGGGVIVPEEIRELHEYGVARIFSPEDGRDLGLEGMVRHMLRECDFSTVVAPEQDLKNLAASSPGAVARLISWAELNGGRGKDAEKLLAQIRAQAGRAARKTPVLGVTGTGGAGKSSLTDELLRRYLVDFEDQTVAVISIDPTRRRTGGALLGDRIRMNSLASPRVYMRSLATRESGTEISEALDEALDICRAAGFDLILVETSGIGQADSGIVGKVDASVYVMTGDYGAATQLEKIEMLDYADFVALNKFERRGSQDALRDIRKQVWRNRGARMDEKPEQMPVFPTIAAQFNDLGVNALYHALLARLSEVSGRKLATRYFTQVPGTDGPRQKSVLPGQRARYLSEISETVRAWHKWARQQQDIASAAGATWQVLADLGDDPPCRLESYPREKLDGENARLRARYNELVAQLDPACRKLLAEWPELVKAYTEPENAYKVRDREIRVANFTRTLSGTSLPKVILPKYRDWGDLLAWRLRENVPGEFPFTAGVFPYKRTGEDPTRMFAGEGPPERTNRRFHLVSVGQPAARLSTAFDSVTLYGEDPHERPDIYGKIGESGVSICTVEDMEILYAGFDLCAPNTSVSMTINGPAPIILAFFMNAATRQQARKWLMQQGRLKPDRAPERLFIPASAAARNTGHEPRDFAWQDPRCFDWPWESIRGLLSDSEYAAIQTATVSAVRGTVQADILKEDQAQNTCIFSIEFALKMMGDVQQWFIEHDVNNYYSVSISGYHIAEAGANPITQLAFTLANGFTYVEAWRARGMDVNDFAPNLSFFFSNGVDAEYSVIGRVARRIWAVAMARLYGGNERSQKLKYHIQTSGRSLHAMEIDFNDIRTTLQALYAIYDNCNSLHTNAFDEAITTPTDNSVRRALAIQHIINKELGLAKNENPLQGSFIIEELTNLVEAAVLAEFDRITERGGVTGAMETQYQRGKIQEESMHYEQLKHSGELPIIGVNTFLNPHPEEGQRKIELARSSKAEKDGQIRRLRDFQKRHDAGAGAALESLRRVALSGGNIFDELIRTVQHCSLGQISAALYQVGGQYRRNM
ncbi:MAG: methylmalonyl-CoA mutase family protein [Planctomycetes bacterium]|jgi:methylmalonyl-CoA mutase|nr:methylmalonyl-CoA mutase family protein [Planctomycetota bacterium]MCL4729066.1 methylmalonyl-CoA mutase family protein [Planctomycetota bacterium]